MESLARHYRPTKFEDVCAQESIIQILKRQLELKQLKNCYLFAGASGCGKTTMARIFANEINNYQGMPIEIDGASNNGVDNVKNIIQSALERSLNSTYKIYIIDECHALTAQAWQAFLKCIEEPPEYTIFIFCTTDPQKIPPTILNRVMRFNFTRISTDIINTRLKYICEQEGFTNYVESCEYISKLSQGCMRDAISLLDKAAAYTTDLNIQNVLNAVGSFSYTMMFDLVNALIDGKEATIITILDTIYNSGSDLKLFIDQFLQFCLDISKYIIFKDIRVTGIPNIMEKELVEATNFKEPKDYYKFLTYRLLNCKNMIKNDSNIKSTIEVDFLSLCRI